MSRWGWRKRGPQKANRSGHVPVEQFLRARAAMGGDAAAGLDGSAAISELRRRAAVHRRADEDDAAADLEDRLLLLTVDDVTVDEAETAVLRRLRLADQDPRGQLPMVGLAEALVAHLHLRDGDASEAADTGREAIRVLRREVIESPEGARPALVLALQVTARALRLDGHRDEAARLEDQATMLLETLSRSDASYVADLDALRSPDPVPPSSATTATGGPDAIARASRQYTAGVDQSRAGNLAEAERSLKQAIDGYRAAQRAGAVHGVDVPRRLALALWRYSMLLWARGRVADALPPGREGVEIGRRLIDAAGPGALELPALISELVTALCDLGEALAAAGRREEQAALLDEAIRRCAGHTDRRVQRALGTALHNAATARMNDVPGYRERGANASAVMRAASELAGRAVDVRNRLVDPAEPITAWELANSLLLHARILLVAGEAAPGVNMAPVVELLTIAWQVLGALGSGAEGLRAELRTLIKGAEHRAPDAVRAARRAGQLPT